LPSAKVCRTTAGRPSPARSQSDARDDDIRGDQQPCEGGGEMQPCPLTSLSRFTRSATTPPHIEKIITGPGLAAVSSPSINSLSVSVRISQSRPKMSDHMPTFENAVATRIIRYSRYRNTEKDLFPRFRRNHWFQAVHAA
jgi:hypothetical protein